MTTPNWTAEVIDALESVPERFEGDELAFLTLTSMVEAQVRDTVAWHIHKNLVRDHLGSYSIVREWNRVDLAVLDHSSGGPKTMQPSRAAMLLEIKVDYSCRFHTTVQNSRLNSFGRDVDSLHGAYAPSAPLPDARFFLDVLVSPMAEIPLELHDKVKYSTTINTAIKKCGGAATVREMAKEVLRDTLETRFDAEVKLVSLGVIGEYQGVPVAHDYFLMVNPAAREPFRVS